MAAPGQVAFRDVLAAALADHGAADVGDAAAEGAGAEGGHAEGAAQQAPGHADPEAHGDIAAMQAAPGEVAIGDILGAAIAGWRGAGLSAFTGDAYRGNGHAAYMRACKKAKGEAAKLAGEVAAAAPLQRAWSEERLRVGDHVGDASSAEQHLHPNTWSARSIVVAAWRQIGKNKVLRAGLDGHHRALDVLTTVSATAFQRQQCWVKAKVQAMLASEACPVINKFYDCTPSRVGFGRLQPVLMPHARYPLKLDNKWRSVSLEEYLKHRPGRNVLRYGTVELLGQGMTCHYLHPETEELFGIRVMCRPRILQSANASCLFTATESEVPEFSAKGLENICEQVPMALVCESPDAASANNRKKAKSSSLAPSNCFHVPAVCDAHQAHRMVAMKEKDSIGNLYSIAASCAHPPFQDLLQHQLHELIQKELVFIRGEADLAVAGRNRDMVEHTLLRRRGLIVGCPEEASTIELDDEANHAATHFLLMWNGDWSVPAICHVCSGCCAGRDDCVSTMFSAAIAIDILQSRECYVPSEDDWGTCGQAAAVTSLGLLCHDLLNRVMASALPDWNAMLPPRDPDEPGSDEADRQRLKIQKKTWRARCVLGDPQRRAKILLLCYLGAPVEKLMAEVQYLDQAGKGLYDVMIDDAQNPFFACKQRLARLVCEGAGGSLGAVFDLMPPADRPALLKEVRALGLDLGAQAAQRVVHRPSSMPFDNRRGPCVCEFEKLSDFSPPLLTQPI